MISDFSTITSELAHNATVIVAFAAMRKREMMDFSLEVGQWSAL